MNKFIVIKYDRRFRDELISDRLVNGLERECPFHISSLHIVDYPNQRIAVASASSSLTGFGCVEYLFATSSGFLVFDGFPVFRGQDLSMPWAERLFRLLKRRGIRAFHEEVQGEYCFAAMVDGKIFASGDFVGLSPIFRMETHGRVGISNRQRLLQRVMLGAVEIDAFAFSWLTGHGNIFGTASPFSGVKLIEPGRFARLDEEGLRIGGFERFYSPADRHGGEPSSGDIKRAVDSIQEQANLIADLDLDPGLKVDITGGMDSRAVVAICLSSRLKDKVEIYQTTGPEGSPEIEVASAVAQAVGVRYKPIINVPRKTAEPTPLDMYWRRMEISAAAVDGSVLPHTSINGISKSFVPRLTGTAGEIYRPHSKLRKSQTFSSIDEVLAMVENYQQRADPFHVQLPETTERQRKHLRHLAQGVVTRGSVFDDVHYGMYAENRLPWWAGYTRANAMGTRRLGVLADLTAAKIMFECSPEQRKIDRLHFEIMKAADSRLLTVPFLNNKFSSNLEKYANGIDLPSAPYMVKNQATQTFLNPWMFDFIERDHKAIFDFILSKNDSIVFSAIDRKKIERKLKVVDSWKNLMHSATSLLAILNMRLVEEDSLPLVKQGEFKKIKISKRIFAKDESSTLQTLGVGA